LFIPDTEYTKQANLLTDHYKSSYLTSCGYFLFDTNKQNGYFADFIRGVLESTRVSIWRGSSGRLIIWRGGRAAEGAALEKRYPVTGIVGSNPTLSASLHIADDFYKFTERWPSG
jgi:hypothetical protein